MEANSHKLLNFFSEYVTDHKKVLIDKILSYRTRHLTFVLEDIYQSQNASAIVRTCDCFGIQDLHVVEGRHKFHLNPRVVHGASKWINIYKYTDTANNTAACFDSLRSRGYQILATSPDKDCPSIHTLDLKNKVALVFGTEKAGISEFTMKNADGLVTIPMHGFTESLNVSVCAAICANVLINKLHGSDAAWKLTDAEKDEIKLSWYRGIVHRSDVLEKEFLKTIH